MINPNDGAVRQPTDLVETSRDLAEQIAHLLIVAPSSSRMFKIESLRSRVIELFACSHGWKPSSRPFSPTVLARMRVWGRDEPYDATFIDHPCYFRTPDRRAAGIAAHLYDANQEHRRGEIRDWATRRGLEVCFPKDFPSWWVPGGTTLCIYRPANPMMQLEGRG